MKKILLTILLVVPSFSVNAEELTMIERFGENVDTSCQQIAESASSCSIYSCVTENPIFTGLKIRHSLKQNVNSKICEYSVQNFAIDKTGEENIYHEVTCDLDSKEAQNLINSIKGKKFKDWGVDFQYIVNFYQKYCFTGV